MSTDAPNGSARDSYEDATDKQMVGANAETELVPSP